MKKTYIIPANNVHTIQVVHMMALSTGGDSESVSNSDFTSTEEGGKPKYEQDARESNNIWSNEW